ncbi:MAG: hypothetical protein V5A43_12185 [Haloarculaceae archaeon]
MEREGWERDGGEMEERWRRDGGEMEERGLGMRSAYPSSPTDGSTRSTNSSIVPATNASGLADSSNGIVRVDEIADVPPLVVRTPEGICRVRPAKYPTDAQ